MKTNVRQEGVSAGLQFAILIVLCAFFGTSLYLHDSFLGRAGFWLMKGYFLERFILFCVFIFLVCLAGGLWLAREVITYRRNFQITGALYGFFVLCMGSLFLPIYLSIKCSLLRHCAIQRLMIRTYFENIPWYVLTGLLPMVLVGIWLAYRIKKLRAF